MPSRDHAERPFRVPGATWAAVVVPGIAAALLAYAGDLFVVSLPTVSPADGAELRSLARLALLVFLPLLPAAALARGTSAPIGWSVGVVGIAALLLLLPAGPLRGVAVSCGLVLAVVVTVWSGTVGSGTVGSAASKRPFALFSTRLVAARLVPAAFAVQALALSSELLVFPLDDLTLIRLLALPLAAVWLATLVARRQGTITAIVATLAAVAVAGRFSAGVLVALLVPAVAPVLFEASRSPRRRLLGAAVLLAPLLVDPTLGALGVLAALARTGRRAWPAALVVAVGLLSLGPSDRSWLEAASLAPSLLLVLPFAAVPLARVLVGRRWEQAGECAWQVLVPLFVGWVGLRFGPPEVTLTVPAVLLVTGPAGASPRATEHRVSDWIAWTGAWAAGGLLAAAYPWLRPAGVDTLLRILRLDQPAWLPSALALALVALFGAIGGDQRRVGPWIPAAALALVLLPSASRLPGATFVLTWPAVELSAQQRSWTSPVVEPFPGPAVVVVDSAVAFGVGVERGATLATVRWIPTSGAQRSTSIRWGLDSDEWTAAPKDPGGGARGEPWLSLLAPGGDRLVHRYRARRPLGPLAPGPGRVVVELAEGLPPELRLSLYRLTLAAAEADAESNR